MGPWSSGVQMAILIMMIYLALTGNLEPANLIVGLLIGAGISLMVRPRQLSIRWRRLHIALWSILRYIGVLFIDMISSAFQVGRLLLHPDLPIKPGIVAIDAGCQSELGTALSAHAITLTPGELVLGMDDQGILYAHCLDISQSAAYASDAQQLRQELLSKIFE
jgi:multicomponent Na+:H+ antiporter subunit E